MEAFISSFVRDESAVTAMEYGMIASLTAVAIIVALSNLGIELNKTFTTISRAIADANARAQ
ncbi:MAG TPA: Flp family type IVb pilin [Alphaproteobacteria bacterium]|nr:Flp family type IVb pilin [Alphaproteobacteria bacterium]